MAAITVQSAFDASFIYYSIDKKAFAFPKTKKVMTILVGAIVRVLARISRNSALAQERFVCAYLFSCH